MSATLILPGVLRDCAGGARSIAVATGTLRQVLDEVAATHPSLERRLRDEQGSLRRHVLVFVDGTNVRDADGVDTVVAEGAQVYVSPAISGGCTGPRSTRGASVRPAR